MISQVVKNIYLNEQKFYKTHLIILTQLLPKMLIINTIDLQTNVFGYLANIKFVTDVSPVSYANYLFMEQIFTKFYHVPDACHVGKSLLL